jgi:putative transposase
VTGPSTTTTTAVVTRAYAYALDPTPEQVSVLRSHVGGSRFAYNTMLGLVKDNWDENRAKKDAGIEVTKDDWINTGHFGLLYLWAEHRDDVAPWWSQNGSSTYNDAAQRLSKAFTNFRKGHAKFPCFKRKGQGGSVRFMGPAVRLTDSHHVRIARIGELKTYESTRKIYRHLERGTGKVLAATLTERGGKWMISFTVEVTRVIPAPRAPMRIIGIDVGIATLYTGATTHGEHVLEVENPRHFLKAERKLAHAQRIASRRQGPKKGVASSKRWKKANVRVENIHAGGRELSQEPAQPDHVHAREALRRDRARGPQRGGHGEEPLARQAHRRRRVGRVHPSARVQDQMVRLYSRARRPVLPLIKNLDQRTYHCGACGLVLGRDHNAAINLARQGLPGTSSGTGRGGEVSPAQQTLVATAHPDEASTDTPLAVGA